MASERASDSVLQFYTRVLEKNGITNSIQDVQVTKPNLDGEHFSSTCETVKITFGDEAPPLELFVKRTVGNPQYAAQMHDLLMFEKEAHFFNLIVPAMQQFCLNKLGSVDLLDNLYPKCYYADDDTTVLEDVTKTGHILLDKRIMHSYSHARTVLINLAKFHAVTYCMIQKNGTEEFFKEFPLVAKPNLWSQSDEKVTGPWLQNIIDRIIKILEESYVEGSNEALTYFKKYSPNGFSKLAKHQFLEQGACGLVLNHGDFWNSNLMFKIRDSTKEPVHAMLIDLQTVFVGSPALDMSDYLFLTLEPSIRRDKWEELLQLYYEYLNRNIDMLKGHLEFSFDDLKRDFRTKFESGFFMGLSVMIFGFESLDDIGDLENIEGDIMDHWTNVMNDFITRNEDNNEKYAQDIVLAYKEIEKIMN